MMIPAGRGGCAGLRPLLLLGILTLAVAATGCRSRGREIATADKPEDRPAGEGGTADSDGDDAPAKSTGPKVMGYEYFTRQSASVIRGSYSDKQDNQTVGRDSSVDGLRVTGSRYRLEHYPIVVENFPYSQFGYSLLEIRREKPAADWWLARNTFVVLGGYILPKFRLLAPVVGIHWEWNKVDMGLDDSPEVTKADIRATVVGVDFRQKFYGVGDWFSAFYHGKLHLLNVTLPNNGWELEVGVGNSLQWGFLRLDLSLDALEQRYHAKRAPGRDEGGWLIIDSSYRAYMGTVTLWI